MDKILRIVTQDKTGDIDYFSSIISQDEVDVLFAYNQGKRMFLGRYDNIECQKIMQDIRNEAQEIDDGVHYYEMPEYEVEDE